MKTRILFFIFLFQSIYAEDYERIYLATFPRSGNHWMRELIEEATHIATSSVYPDAVPLHQPDTLPWVAFSTLDGYHHNCRQPNPGEIVVVKTHFPYNGRTLGDQLPYTKTVCIVRHPVDCLYSLFLHWSKTPPSTPMPQGALIPFINSMRAFNGYWSEQNNVLILRYEDLLQEPHLILKTTLAFINYPFNDDDIERAILLHPPQGQPLKHLHNYTQEQLEYIAEELKGYMKKYDYHIPGIN